MRKQAEELFESATKHAELLMKFECGTDHAFWAETLFNDKATFKMLAKLIKYTVHALFPNVAEETRLLLVRIATDHKAVELCGNLPETAESYHVKLQFKKRRGGI